MAVLISERGKVRSPHNPAVPAAEDELPSPKGAPSEDALSFGARVAYLDLITHLSVTVPP